MKTVIFTIEVETPNGITTRKCEDKLSEMENILNKSGLSIFYSSYERNEQ